MHNSKKPKIKIFQYFCGWKEKFSEQLKILEALHKSDQELILMLLEEIKLLKKTNYEQLQKENQHFKQTDSKLNLILQTIQKDHESISQQVSTQKEELLSEIGNSTASIHKAILIHKKELSDEIERSKTSIEKKNSEGKKELSKEIGEARNYIILSVVGSNLVNMLVGGVSNLLFGGTSSVANGIGNGLMLSLVSSAVSDAISESTNNIKSELSEMSQMISEVKNLLSMKAEKH
jgi:hypothetical protein